MSDPSNTELTTISSILEERENCLLDEQDCSGDDTDVITEKHAAQCRDCGGYIDEWLDRHSNLSVRP
jgi:hypothetical protein